ncbi:MAG TPA: hypothetical protein VKA84_09685, partial [Gemmatimonadaceae bacterium]|nr:hypothetical protein [Gemmatimonadaceae bacterium]
MDGFWHDVRVGLRGLRRSPGFSLVAALTLALGIGATSAVVTIANAVLLRGLPYREPERLVMLRGRMEKDGKSDEWPLGYQDLEALAGEREAFEALSPVSGARPFNLSADGRVE